MSTHDKAELATFATMFVIVIALAAIWNHVYVKPHDAARYQVIHCMAAEWDAFDRLGPRDIRLGDETHDDALRRMSYQFFQGCREQLLATRGE